MFNIFNLQSLEEFSEIAEKNSTIDQEEYDKYDVKRGLRNNNGTGVLVGLTKIGNVEGYEVVNNERKPVPGTLSYRGIDLNEIVEGFQKENRFGFEEVCYLLLLGKLPNSSQLEAFKDMLKNSRNLPNGFTEDMILKAPSKDIMNKLQRSILVLYSYDTNPDDNSVKNVLRQSIELIARIPCMIAYGYQAKSHYYDKQSLHIHIPRPELSTAENILYMIRPDNKFTKSEAAILDLALVIHAEHGGGNNSTFTTHVVSSAGTDTYSAISAAVGSLKGTKHGGANIKVMAMMKNIKENVSNWEDKEEIESYLRKILDKKAFDKSGLIYGMGHAVYTISDPRAVLLKKQAFKLAEEKGRIDEFNIYKNVEEVTKKIFKERGRNIATNVDLYSGFVYDMLNIPVELYTPLFATARVAGWCAHRIEQIVAEKKIIRPAYKGIKKNVSYEKLEDRDEDQCYTFLPKE
ncbi:citrate/2-methylcitrate synthase [Clostridium bornimense]|uniref:citrate/2-methylcitrate synthase n=1 Tax=Clostridium bornimense TaxID=1216932 RepID=UPI001C0FD4F0|nr:citrate/2-methylcitrate synthase [Clostridium bornimense]MBU5315036.1 citrate/2-methylcitrate synthase [Clostridium bornimense]